MNQKTVTDVLTDIQTLTETVAVSVFAEETGDVNSPGYEVEAALTLHSILIVPVSIEDRIRAQADYDEPLTDRGYCRDDDSFVKGAKLQITHRRADSGVLVPLTTETYTTEYLILSVTRTPGMPGPWDQVVLDLWRVTP